MLWAHPRYGTPERTKGGIHVDMRPGWPPLALRLPTLTSCPGLLWLSTGMLASSVWCPCGPSFLLRRTQIQTNDSGLRIFPINQPLTTSRAAHPSLTPRYDRVTHPQIAPEVIHENTYR